VQQERAARREEKRRADGEILAALMQRADGNRMHGIEEVDGKTVRLAMGQLAPPKLKFLPATGLNA
jgi:hypothetical protein